MKEFFKHNAEVERDFVVCHKDIDGNYLWVNVSFIYFRNVGNLKRC